MYDFKIDRPKLCQASGGGDNIAPPHRQGSGVMAAGIAAEVVEQPALRRLWSRWRLRLVGSTHEQGGSAGLGRIANLDHLLDGDQALYPESSQVLGCRSAALLEAANFSRPIRKSGEDLVVDRDRQDSLGQLGRALRRQGRKPSRAGLAREGKHSLEGLADRRAVVAAHPAGQVDQVRSQRGIGIQHLAQFAHPKARPLAA